MTTYDIVILYEWCGWWWDCNSFFRTTENKGLLYKCSEILKLNGYVDSDDGGDYFIRKSTTGYIFLLGYKLVGPL